MEEAHRVGEGIFDQHALGVAGDDRCGLRLHVVGEQDGGFVMAEIGDEELAERALLGARLLLIDPRGAVFAVGHVERNGAPSRGRQLIDLGQEFWRAAAQGQEGDAGLIEPVETVVCGELGIEDQMARRAAMVGSPEVDEAEDLFGLLAFADVGVGVAEHVAVGILGEERENAGLAATSLGHVVRLDHRVLAEVRHGMEVEIERLAGDQRFAGELLVPEAEQPGDLLRGDLRGIFCQETPLRHGIEAAEQREPLVGHQSHDVALAFDRPQLERQRGAQRMRGRDHA